MEAPSKLSVYDMDKTITRRPSWMPWLFFYARREAPWRLLLAPLLLLPALGFLFCGRDRKRLKERAQALLMGRAPRPAVERTALAFAERFGARHERPGALARLAADRAAGFEIWLATASCRYYAEALAQRWGIETVVATEGRWRGDRLVGLAGANCYGLDKLTMILAALSGRPAESRFASDHISDLPALLWADTPLAVAPDKALRRLARQRGWAIADWR